MSSCVSIHNTSSVMSSVCRICLAGNMSMQSLKNNLHISFYEKLTNTKFNSKDARPRAVCCYCYQKLLRCRAFAQMAVRSEKILSHLYDRHLKKTQDNISEFNMNIKHCLPVATMTLDCETIDGKSTNADSQVTIKDEPLSSIDINEEVTSEPDKLLEGESIPEKSKCQIIFEEDIIDWDNDMEDLVSNTHVEQSETDDSAFNIKDEPLSSIEIKKEMTTELDKVPEVGPFLESSTKSRLTFEEDHSNQEKDMEEWLHKIHVEKTRLNVSKMPLSCYKCNKIFDKKSILISHIRESHPAKKRTKTNRNKKKKFACHACGKTFIYECILRRHMIIHSDDKPFACDVCGKQFYQKSSLIVHIRSHTGEKPFACPICEKQFSCKSNIVTHMRVHTGEKPFACNVCDKQFSVKDVLNSHMRIHTGEMPFACHVCERRFKHKKSLKTHMTIHTNEKPFACNVCDKKFTQKPVLDSHMRIHAGEKPFACGVCEKRFIRKKYLSNHMKIHTDGKPFACNVCDKQFHQKCELVSHMRTHTGEKPFACNACDKRFNRKCLLVKHKRTHTDDNPFACNGCDKQFTQKCNLVSHIMRTHTGEKPFACNVCDKQFYTKGVLVAHTRTHTGEKRFVCLVCERPFGYKRDLENHMRIHTREKNSIYW